MKHRNDYQIENLLKQSIRPVKTELERNLWPQMRQRLEACSSERAVPWFDWVLLMVVVFSMAVFPHSILFLMYHL